MANPVRVRTSTGWQNLAIVGPRGPEGSGGGGGGGADLTYIGDFTPGTYNDGDIVWYGGAAYMCVVDGTTTPPVAWDTGSAPPGTGVPTGGLTGEVLAKMSPANFDATWVPPAYVHDQSAVAATWAVAHNLNRYPSVMVVDTGGSTVEPDIHYTDANNLTVLFGSPTSGKAYLN